MNTILDAPTRGLLRVAFGLPDATELELADWMRRARDAGTPALWLEELLLSSVLFVGYARALMAAGAYRRLEPEPAPGGEPSRYEEWEAWRARGEELCRKVYGKHYDQLRHNVRALHPALDLWMVVEGYGKTLARPGLDAWRRELCSIAMLVPQEVPRQLLAHLRGALNVGAPPDAVDEVLAIGRDAKVTSHALTVARELWEELKDEARTSGRA